MGMPGTLAWSDLQAPSQSDLPAGALLNDEYIWPTVDGTIVLVAGMVASAGPVNQYRIADW